MYIVYIIYNLIVNMKQTDSYQHCLAGGLSYGSNGPAWRSCSHFGPDPQHVDSSMVIRWRCVVTFLVTWQENSAEIMNCNDTCMFDVRHVKANISTGINPQVFFSTYDDSWFFEFNSGFCEAMLEIWFGPDDVWFLCLVQNFMSYIYYENYEIHCSFSSVRSKHRELQASIACLSFLIAGDLGFSKNASNHMDIISWIPAHDSAQKTRWCLARDVPRYW